MKVLYIDQTGQLGGAEFSLLDWLTGSNVSNNVLLFEHGPFEKLLQEKGISVEVLPMGAAGEIRRESGFGTVLGALLSIWTLSRMVAERASSYDAIYTNSQKAFLIGAFARRGKQKMIWHLRDILTADHFSGILRRVVITVANRSADLIIVNSKATGESFVAAGGRRSKVRLVYPGIRPDAFDAVTPEQANLLRASICPNAKFVVGIFGRLTPWKGQHILLEAIAQLPGYEAVVVGDALFGELDYKQKVLERAQQPDLNGRVHFLGFRKDIPALMKSIDVAIHASVAPEPFGRVIVEGMLAGKPVIATRAGGAAEIVQDGVTGLLVTPGSVEELRLAIVLLATDRSLYEALARAGREDAEKKLLGRGFGPQYRKCPC